jgi:uncharacterized protein (DUF2147 family)
MLKYLLLAFFIPLGLNSKPGTVPESDQICGKWMSSEKNMIVEVYHDAANNSYKGRILWFRDDPSKPMDEWLDTKNPDPALRTRKILGMDVMRNLKYDSGSKSWEDGVIYEAKTGREWNASAYIDKQGLLKVKGYWHLKIIGRTMTFKRT